jgi:DNA-binding PadR family transcriptional regulator
MALGPGPRHGYGIIKDIEERTGAEGTLRSGTLYTALQRLTDDGLIEPATAPPDTGSADTRRKYFALTSLGKEAVTLELGRLRALVHEGVARKLIAAEPNA